MNVEIETTLSRMVIPNVKDLKEAGNFIYIIKEDNDKMMVNIDKIVSINMEGTEWAQH